jgi:hypothetical protein
MADRITAKIEARLYIPYGWIAIDFCHLEFWGKDTEKYKKGWEQIEYSDYHKYDKKIVELNNKIKKIDVTISKMNWLRKLTKKYKETEKINILKEQIYELKKLRFKSSYQLLNEADSFLRKNGFILINKTSNGKECEINTYIYKLTL